MRLILVNDSYQKIDGKDFIFIFTDSMSKFFILFFKKTLMEFLILEG